jgi:uncharacterized OB-fold protein
MSVWICGECTAAYAPDALTCPQCGTNEPIKEAEQLEKEHQEMPKVTVHNGPSNESAEPGQPGYVAPASTEDTNDATVEATEDNGEESEVVDYNDFTVEELKAELKGRERDLALTGNKPELVARLEADDRAQAAAEHDETAE